MQATPLRGNIYSLKICSGEYFLVSYRFSKAIRSAWSLAFAALSIEPLRVRTDALLEAREGKALPEVVAVEGGGVWSSLSSWSPVVVGCEGLKGVSSSWSVSGESTRSRLCLPAEDMAHAFHHTAWER